jgi:hypothetical protein
MEEDTNARHYSVWHKAASIFLTVLLSTAIIAGISYAFRGFDPQSPEEVVAKFYTDWTSYEGSPVGAQIYRGHASVSEDLALKLDQTIASFPEGGGFDPVLCAQDLPESLSITLLSKDRNNAEVLVEEDFWGSLKNVDVALVKNWSGWKIKSIDCGTENSSSYSDEQVLVSDYIRNNISSLSPEKEVLGGTFYILKMDFLENKEILVEYEDGHNLYQAKAVYEINTHNQVKINSFKIIIQS